MPHKATNEHSPTKTEDRNVPGRNTIVKAAMIFIEVPSSRASRAMVVLVAASCCVTRLKTYAVLVVNFALETTYQVHGDIFA
jgi:hypothetical protein